MSKLQEILQYNRQFVAQKGYEPYETTKYPNKKLAILTCMDARLTELLPAALHLKNGDAKMIKNAGACITHPYGSAMRSLLVAVYDLGVEDIFVVGHYDCGMQSVNPQAMVASMLSRGVREQTLDEVRRSGIDLNCWLRGFSDPCRAVQETVQRIREHPLLPADVAVTGFVIDPETGRLDCV